MSRPLHYAPLCVHSGVDGAITFTLNRLVHVLNHHADAILRREYAMTYSHFIYLVKLAEQQPLEMTALAKHLGVTRAAISQRTPWFERHGLVTRSADPSHGRRVLLRLTPDGAAMLRSASLTLEARFRDAFTLADGIDLNHLNALLEHLLARLEGQP